MDISLNNFINFVIQGIVDGSLYALIGVGFALIIWVTGRFHMAYSITFALTAYLVAEIGLSAGIPYVLSVILGVLCGGVVGVLIEVVLYRPLAPRAGRSALLAIFVTSLGLATAGQSGISLAWMHSAALTIPGFTNHNHHVGRAYFTNLNIITVVVAWIVIVAVHLFRGRTRYGRMMRAVQVNPDFSLAVGISPPTVYALVFGIGTAIGGIAAAFTATATAATPDLGSTQFLYAITIAFLAGELASPLHIALLGLGIGLLSALSHLVVSSEWTSVIVFGVLLVYIAVRPVWDVTRLRLLAKRERWETTDDGDNTPSAWSAPTAAANPG
jgi:branched-subunit amino acid ABC-type transport system permease component